MTRALWGGRWSPSLLLVPNLPAPTRPARRPRLVQPALHDSPPREPRCITGLGRGRERTRAARGAARRRRARAALGLAPFSWPVCCNNLVLIVCHREMKSVLVIIDGNYIRLLFKDGPAQESGDTRTLTCMCSRDTSAHSGDGRRPRSVHHGVRCPVAGRAARSSQASPRLQRNLRVSVSTHRIQRVGVFQTRNLLCVSAHSLERI